MAEPRISLADVINRDFSEGPAAPAPVGVPEAEYAIDSSKISRFFEPTSVQRRRVFEGVEPSIDRAQSTPAETPVIDPVTQAKAELAGLDDEGLQAIRSGGSGDLRGAGWRRV